jgi:hypothetical protein
VGSQSLGLALLVAGMWDDGNNGNLTLPGETSSWWPLHAVCIAAMVGTALRCKHGKNIRLVAKARAQTHVTGRCAHSL